MKETEQSDETDPNILAGDIEMHAPFGQVKRRNEAIITTIEAATCQGLTVVLYVLNERDVPPEIRRNDSVTVAEVDLGEVRLP